MEITMDKHVRVIGILYIVLSALGLLTGFLLVAILAGSGAISGDRTAMLVTSGVGVIIGGIILVFSVPGLIGGIYLLQNKEWARILVLVLSFINLISIPFGTALGIYAIWALMKDETIRLFRPESQAPAGAQRV
jgi:hypothetical protein